MHPCVQGVENLEDEEIVKLYVHKDEPAPEGSDEVWSASACAFIEHRR